MRLMLANLRRIGGDGVVLVALLLLTVEPLAAQSLAQQDRPQQVAIVDVPPDLRPTNASLYISIVLGSVPVIVAFWGAREFAKRSRVDTFRAMRAAFLELRNPKNGSPGLPHNWASLDEHAQVDATAFKGLQLYWLNAFDEWYITKYRRPYLYRGLWNDYYCHVMTVAAQRPLMLIALLEAFKASARAPLDREFVREMLECAGRYGRRNLLSVFSAWKSRTSSGCTLTEGDIRDFIQRLGPD